MFLIFFFSVSFSRNLPRKDQITFLLNQVSRGYALRHLKISSHHLSCLFNIAKLFVIAWWINQMRCSDPWKNPIISLSNQVSKGLSILRRFKNILRHLNCLFHILMSIVIVWWMNHSYGVFTLLEESHFFSFKPSF